MAKRILLLSIVIFYFKNVFAQEGTIKGKIFDSKTKDAIGGVNVYLDGKGVTTSDTGGNYHVKCSAGSHSLEF
ncbi:MAG TPA: hypothetical protein VII99_11480, partial [Bacteroidia bacterium]